MSTPVLWGLAVAIVIAFLLIRNTRTRRGGEAIRGSALLTKGGNIIAGVSRAVSSWLKSLVEPRGEALMKHLAEAKAREEERGLELEKELKAKKELAEAKKRNTKLRQDIAGVGKKR